MNQDPIQQFDEEVARLQTGLQEDQMTIDAARLSQQQRVAQFAENGRALLVADKPADSGPVEPAPGEPLGPEDFDLPPIPVVQEAEYVVGSHEGLRALVRGWTGQDEDVLIVRIAQDMPHLYIGGYQSLSDARSLARADGKPLRIWLVLDQGVTVGGLEISEKLCKVPEVRIFGGTIRRLQDHFSCVFSHERDLDLESVIGLHGCAFQPLSDESYGGHGAKNAIFFNAGTGLLHMTGLTTKPAEGKLHPSWKEHFCYAHSPNRSVADGCLLDGAYRTFFQFSNRGRYGAHEGDHIFRRLMLGLHGNAGIPFTSEDGGQAISCWGNPNGRTLIEDVQVLGTTMGGLGILQEGDNQDPLLDDDGFSHNRVVVRGFECSQIPAATKPKIIVEGAREVDLGGPLLSGPGKDLVVREPLGNIEGIAASV